LTFLLAGTRERRVYRVESGDTLWQIANRHGMALDEILKANPGLAAERIYPGQNVSLIVPKPLVTVEARYVRVYRRAIPFPVSVTWDAAMYRTDRRVERPGSVGEKEITEQVVRRNAEVADETVLKEVVLRWPQTQFLTAGTRRTPQDLLADSLADGEVAQLTSPFGWRWSRMHGGVDWAMPTGTPIRAWRDGTVKFAGTVIGYGRLVILEHPGDTLTYYAHLSRFHVIAGAAVGAGQVIALSGNTGNSTGPHLHFEIHEKGALLDPMAVLSGERAAVGGP
jgi:murein DD-endopeptidase MepM/ murein hydrolase activator NlpD